MLPLSISLAIALNIAINGNFSPLAYLLSTLIIFVGFFAIKKDTASPKTSFSGLFSLTIISMFLNKFIKDSAPFPVNLLYVLTLFALAYFVWRVWDEYKQPK